MFADHQGDALDQLRYYASFVVTPVYEVANLPQALGEKLSGQFSSRQALIEENVRLRETLLEQSRRLQKLEHLSAENQRLNSLLKASASVDESVMRAQLVSESPDPFTKRVLINRGQRDGVFQGQPVLDAFGLVGQVVDVAPYTSWVLLISDPQHATPIQINRNGIRAVASGAQGVGHSLELRNLPNTSDVREGDLLVSSGLGQRFPAGYPVGVITRVENNPGQAFATVIATPSAQLEISRNLLLVFQPEATEEPEGGLLSPEAADAAAGAEGEAAAPAGAAVQDEAAPATAQPPSGDAGQPTAGRGQD